MQFNFMFHSDHISYRREYIIMEPLDDIITPTTAFWQELLPAGVAPAAIGPPYRTSYPARLPDGRTLVLPLRRIASEPDARWPRFSLTTPPSTWSTRWARRWPAWRRISSPS
jgi:hypothetical protein